MRARVLALLGAVTLTTGLAGAGAEAQVAPHVDVIAPPDTVDEHPLVRLLGFPAGSYVVSICGNDGRNGSADCDLLGAHGVAVRSPEAELVRMAIAPPVACPCVARVTTPSNETVGSFPIEVPSSSEPATGVAAPTPVVASASQVEVSAELTNDQTWPQAIVASLGGSARRQLRVVVRNAGSVPLPPLTMAATVGPDRSKGAPVALPPVPVIAPGEERVVEVPVELDAPAIGGHVLAGRVVGLDRPVPFEASTEVEPWGVRLLASLVVVALAARAIARLRQRPGRRSDRAAVLEGCELVAGQHGPPPSEPDDRSDDGSDDPEDSLFLHMADSAP